MLDHCFFFFDGQYTEPFKLNDRLSAAFVSGAVPVYFGPPEQLVALPHPESVIVAASFPDVHDLTAYIRKAAGDFDVYKKHFQWGPAEVATALSERDCGDVDPWYCQMCERFAYLRAVKASGDAPAPWGGNASKRRR